MSLQAISAKRIFDGEQFHQHSAILWQDNEIVSILAQDDIPDTATVHEYNQCTITPGFIDIQVNGGGGVMFNQDTDLEGIQTICRAHRKHGTAYLLPTLISDTKEKIERALAATQSAINDRITGVLGVHLEGPWLNPDKKGAHDSKHFYTPSISELEKLPWLTSGSTLVTLAPEMIPTEVLSWLSEKNIIVSCGHSNASQAQLGAEKIRHVDGFTHLYNAMSPLEGREPGVVGTALLSDNTWCSIITDGIHVSKESTLLAHRSKPAGKLFVVTDAMATVGSQSDTFTLNNETVQVVNGKLVNAQGSLAGAHIGMDQSVAKLIEWGIPEEEALKMASTYPAKAMHQDNLGYLKRGFLAAMTILDGNHNSQAVVVDGQLYS
ncbi:putative N-acetylglucosamine-6-phosphate deacetylase [Vibrio nigripulchritudo SO65]|uniref:N-acetylglucosamine-6-phosphate deacetylase n=1 Tax=Vibrio nigripulchritudo TaxID=28173 RepID=UPI0003B1F05D|nr:N-acetylglucosamine-6-phosphate deacetylase [Vibrio nigripulchritudo]CCN35856.1 putative N-acetylglucosamine-6-phosphate deacetylase [Vibrio nigripulchritudo AM115]CCN39252.1 putative N-acetylglucosamine-6-phosphate deacetylase [Vibrio nigripulchritudo FTn2]CCN64878.1 putative N-acetylglucosamine-6-phosphate deacetylase [Vibrio nigripulchritudo POn4]CCN79168.1 putative N-acetylglucosamine-6-phosphate deacetylase [Vibrio nigripulchritudo SO65]